jgi:AmmeMemoRadiSam system protein A
MHAYVKLAKDAVAAHFLGDSLIKLEREAAPELLKNKAGVFVTIYNGKKLCGCIGTFVATKNNLAEEIISNAISAATADYRFNRITPDEMSELTFEVSILAEPEEVKSVKNLDPRKYGVIVQSGTRRGLLLPDLEGVDTPEQQINIAASKGDIDLRNNQFKLYRFSTTKYI